MFWKICAIDLLVEFFVGGALVGEVAGEYGEQ